MQQHQPPQPPQPPQAPQPHQLPQPQLLPLPQQAQPQPVAQAPDMPDPAAMADPAAIPGAPAAAAAGVPGVLPSLPMPVALGMPAVDAAACPRLAQVVAQLAEHVAANPAAATYNRKPFFALLNEICQKKGFMPPQVDEVPYEVPYGPIFKYHVRLHGRGVMVAEGTGIGRSKMDAKHNAAAACLDSLLAVDAAQPHAVQPADLRQLLISAPSAAGGGGGGGAAAVAAVAGAGGEAMPPTPEMEQTAAIMATDPFPLFPRTQAMMQALHRQPLPAARSKSLVMLVEEYAAKSRLTASFSELPASPTARPFSFRCALTDAKGDTFASADGPPQGCRSKQEARQSAAAALLELLLSTGGAMEQQLAGVQM